MRRNIFKSVDDVLGSDLWKRISEDIPANNSRIFNSSRLENMIYNDLRKTTDIGLDDIIGQGSEKLNTFPSLVQDTFQAIYSIKPKRTDESTLTADARIFNREIMDSILSSAEYPALKAICEGRDLPAYEAVNEFADSMLSKLDELLEAANNAESGENKKLLEIVKTLEEQYNKLTEQISNTLERHENNSISEESEKRLLKAANSANSKQRQIKNLIAMVNENIRKNKNVFQNTMDAAVSSAREKAELTVSVISSWGLEGANPETLKHNTELLQRVKRNSKITGIAKYLGKYREIFDNARKNSFAFGRGDKYDIILGNDFTRAVTSAESFFNGGTEFKGPLLKAAEVIENEGFSNADVLFLTDGDCPVTQTFIDSFKEKRSALNFTVTAIILDKGTEGSEFSVKALCDKVYRLSEVTPNEVSETLIRKFA